MKLKDALAPEMEMKDDSQDAITAGKILEEDHFQKYIDLMQAKLADVQSSLNSKIDLDSKSKQKSIASLTQELKKLKQMMTEGFQNLTVPSDY